MAAPFRPHLLVVDDEACIREALTAALCAIYHVHAAAFGRGGVCAPGCAPYRRHHLDPRLGVQEASSLCGCPPTPEFDLCAFVTMR